MRLLYNYVKMLARETITDLYAQCITHINSCFRCFAIVHFDLYAQRIKFQFTKWDSGD